MTTPPYDPTRPPTAAGFPAPPLPGPTRSAPHMTAPPLQPPVGADTAVAAGPQPQQARRAPVRDRYFDLLRAVALFRVVLYHLMGWAWLPALLAGLGLIVVGRRSRERIDSSWYVAKPELQ